MAARILKLIFLWLSITSHQQWGLAKIMKNTSVRRVAVVGGGIAGLSCAKVLQTSTSPIEVTVFDTGRLRPGGRCSSRLPGDLPAEGKKHNQHRALSTAIVDHAAQIITVPPGFSAFQKQVEEWERQGILTRFPQGSVVEIRSSKTNAGPPVLAPVNRAKDRVMYYGTNGMASIPLTMKDGLSIEQDIWVSPSYGARHVNGKWKLVADGRPLGEFDQLVIAHNGKCADRLLSQSPAKVLHSLLRVNFAPTVPSWGGNKMTLNSIYSLSFCVPKSSPLSTVFPFVSGFIRNEPQLSFLSCNTRKYPATTTTGNQQDDMEIWTLLSSGKFAKQHKAPQEFLPDNVVSQVTGLMLSALERSLSLPSGVLYNAEQETLQTMDSRLQLWGAAVPVNVWNTDEGFCYDAQYQVGACGDWLLHPSTGGAWESGYRLGQFLISSEASQVKSVGLPPEAGAFLPAASSRASIGSL